MKERELKCHWRVSLYYKLAVTSKREKWRLYLNWTLALLCVPLVNYHDSSVRLSLHCLWGPLALCLCVLWECVNCQDGSAPVQVPVHDTALVIVNVFWWLEKISCLAVNPCWIHKRIASVLKLTWPHLDGNLHGIKALNPPVYLNTLTGGINLTDCDGIPTSPVQLSCCQTTSYIQKNTSWILHAASHVKLSTFSLCSLLHRVSLLAVFFF